MGGTAPSSQLFVLDTRGPVVAAQGGGDVSVFFIPLASSLEAGRALEEGGRQAQEVLGALG